MDENREDILNDLIKYYDGDTASSPDEDLSDPGNTRVIGTPPQEEILGDTTMIHITRKERPQPAEEKEEVSGETMRIAPKKPAAPAADATRKIVVTIKSPEESPVQEEVLGNLDLSGHQIQPEKPAAEPEPPAKEEIDPIEEPEIDVEPEPLYEPEEEPEERRGVWHALKPLWITLILSALLAGGFKFYITDTGIIASYKRNFVYNLSVILDKLGIDIYGTLDSETLPVIGDRNLEDLILTDASDLLEESQGKNSSSVRNITENGAPEDAPSQYDQVEDRTVTVPFDEADSSAFSIYDNGVVCAKSNYVCFMNADGETEWEQETTLPDPLIASAGKYVALASENGTQVCLFEKNKLLFTVEAENPIKTCDVSERGDIVLTTGKESYKGAVEVINRKGEQIFSWSSGVNYITAASILRTRLIAVSLVNASGTVTSYIMLFDVHSSEPVSGLKLEGTLIFDTVNCGTSIYASGDNSISSLRSDCRLGYDMRFDNAVLTHSAADKKGNRAVTFTVDNLPVMNVYNKRGEEVYSAAIEALPDFVDIFGSTILYNNGRNIICGKYSSDTRSGYTAPMTIRGLKLINSKVYMVIYDDSLEFIRI